MITLGFNMTAFGQHPWGTSTSLAMFDGCLIEIMGMYDESLIDEMPAGNFRFGRHVYSHLMQREGIALTALHCTDWEADVHKAQAAGFKPTGHLEFGRDVTLPDGQQDRTKTTLVLMPDLQWPRLSFFLCQQHRPELIYVPQWLEHPNTVHGIKGITIVAEPLDQNKLLLKFNALYGNANSISGGYELETANGSLYLLSRQSAQKTFGRIPEDIPLGSKPCIIGVDLAYSNKATLHEWLVNSGLSFSEKEGVFTLRNADDIGNTFLRFHCHEPPKKTAGFPVVVRSV
jgi:hypothetical protein